MVVPHPFMPLREEGRDPNVCAYPDCEKVWNHINHQPSLYLANIELHRAAVSDALRKLSETVGAPEDLARTERASGPPRDPSADAQVATWEETPRKLYEVPADGYIPRGFAQMHGLTAASFVGSMGDAARAATANEAAGLKKLAGVQGALDNLYGGPVDPERYDNVTRLDPVWGQPIDCPECGNAYIKGNIRTHLQRDHGWTGDMWTGWATQPSINFLDLSPEEAGPELARDVIAFMDPEVATEDLISMADANIEAVVTEWWLARAKEEAESVVPKAVEYGSNSLMQLGRKMAQLQGREVGDDEALELGCWVNLVQKVERITDSVMRGERCSDDTIYDVGIYIKMVQRIRDVGSWPGV